MSINVPPVKPSWRVLVVAAVLLGLFGMHGLPHSAANCHAPQANSLDHRSGMTHAMPTVSASGIAELTGLLPMLAGQHSPMQSAACVATLPRANEALVTLTLIGLVTLAALGAALVGIRLRGRYTSRRAPPIWGVGLLHLVCISRT